MSKNVDGFKISANRTPYRRAGLDLSVPLLIAQDAVSREQLATLKADPIVHIAEIGVPAEDIAPDNGTGLPAATTEAELIDQIQQVEDLQSLETIGAGEQRPAVIQAIEAQRTAIAQQPIKLPTKKAELQSLLTERGIEYAEADTVPQLTELAKARLNVAE